MSDDLTDLTVVEQVCWLAAGDGGRVDLERPRSARSQGKIDAALDAGAIDSEGWLTARGRELATMVEAEHGG